MKMILRITLRGWVFSNKIVKSSKHMYDVPCVQTVNANMLDINEIQVVQSKVCTKSDKKGKQNKGNEGGDINY